MNEPQNPEYLNLAVPLRGETVPFLFFPSSRNHILGILEGRTYPIITDVGPVGTIIDIGANVGAASVMLAAHHPDASIHSFEPGPAAAELLMRNAIAFPQIRVHPFGLGNEAGHLKLFRSRWDPMTASTLSSAENSKTFDVVEIRQAACVLSELGIASIDILKIDTEGCELPLLIDLGKFIPDVKIIYLEYHSERDRLRIDELLSPTHVLAFAAVRHPHRGDVCYVHRDSGFARNHNQLAIGS